jgi:hypothetical protein
MDMVYVHYLAAVAGTQMSSKSTRFSNEWRELNSKIGLAYADTDRYFEQRNCAGRSLVNIYDLHREVITCP